MTRALRLLRKDPHSINIRTTCLSMDPASIATKRQDKRRSRYGMVHNVHRIRNYPANFQAPTGRDF